jgi:hypothetical protein
VGHHRSRPLRDHPSASRRILIPFLARVVREARPASSTQLSYASLQLNRRFLLLRGELLRPFAIDINTFESLIVGIPNRHHPMMVFPALIFSVVRDPAFGHRSSPLRGNIVVPPAHSGCGLLRSSGVRLSEAHGDAGDTSDDMQNDDSLSFLTPTTRRRDVGETVEEYDEHFWLNAHSREIIAFGDRRNQCPAGAFRLRSLIYFGITTTSSFGRASSVALSMRRWAITSSGGVCASHSESERSW